MKVPAAPSRAHREECEALLRQRAWLADMAEPLQSKLLGAGRWIHAKPGDQLWMAGEDIGGLWGVAAGTVFSRAGSATPDIAMTDVHAAPFWHISRTLVPGHERIVTVAAQTRVTAVFIPQLTFLQMMEAHPELRFHLLRNISNIFARMTLALSDALIRNPDERCVAVLLRIADRRDVENGPADVPIGQQDLAGLANLSRQKVGDVLRELEAQGLVELGYRRIRLNRPDKLRALLEV
jgi:CRP-like cAMP-binding protein